MGGVKVRWGEMRSPPFAHMPSPTQRQGTSASFNALSPWGSGCSMGLGNSPPNNGYQQGFGSAVLCWIFKLDILKGPLQLLRDQYKHFLSGEQMVPAVFPNVPLFQ